MNVLSVENLSKNYKSVKALQGVTFSVPSGSVYGILGPNGSGKTTLLGIVMDVLKPSAGSFTLFEETPQPSQRKKIGTLLETPNFYHYLSAVENLKITAAIKQKGEEDIDTVLEMVNLISRKNSPFSSYSLGMKQRLAIAASLLGNPDVLLLDEPTNGLDPEGIAEIRTLIIKLAQSGKTIIMASHMLDEVEKVCTHVAILKFGKLITHGAVKDILASEDIVELAASNQVLLNEVMTSFKAVRNIAIDESRIKVSFDTGVVDLAAINQYCFDKGVILTHLQLKRKSLETRFLELTK
jgi:ABC-2 type transport system ATP-binding protein